MKHFVLIIIIFIYSSKAIAHSSHYEGLKKIEMDVLRNNEIIGSTNYFFEFDEDLFFCFSYNLKTYNNKRNWNNPEGWANPENFDKYRW